MRHNIQQVILAILVSWMICAIVTAAGGFPSDPSNPQYKARTDARVEVLKEASWFRVPYPGDELSVGLRHFRCYHNLLNIGNKFQLIDNPYFYFEL